MQELGGFASGRLRARAQYPTYHTSRAFKTERLRFARTLLEHLLKKILFGDPYNEFTD
jgi:hypothetical protein